MANRLVVLIAVLGLCGVALVGQSKPSIQGVWRVTEVTTTGANAGTNKSPQVGVYIFTAKHYSIVRDTAVKPRTAIKEPGKVTADEALAVFGPFMAQSGTYEVSGTTLGLTPLVAKFPPTAGKYTQGAWTFKLEGDNLWVTQTTGPGGIKVTNPTTVRLTRVE